jgi:type II secretory pathway pseudopilin PulG
MTTSKTHVGSATQRLPIEAGFSLIELIIVMAIMIVILGVLASVVAGMETNYSQQRSRTEAINNANTAMDMLVRLIRGSGNNLAVIGIIPGAVGGDGAYHTIRIQSDWNPVDGTTSGVLEDVTFSVANSALQIQEESNPGLDYVTGIGSVTFTYYDNTNSVIADPVVNSNRIALVRIDLATAGSSPMIFTSMAHVRKNP